eukprot:SAG11_NODE_30608_length_299_cov_1.020000_1_plen_39_part_10
MSGAASTSKFVPSFFGAVVTTDYEIDDDLDNASRAEKPS